MSSMGGSCCPSVHKGRTAEGREPGGNPRFVHVLRLFIPTFRCRFGGFDLRDRPGDAGILIVREVSYVMVRLRAQRCPGGVGAPRGGPTPGRSTCPILSPAPDARPPRATPIGRRHRLTAEIVSVSDTSSVVRAVNQVSRALNARWPRVMVWSTAWTVSAFDSVIGMTRPGGDTARLVRTAGNHGTARITPTAMPACRLGERRGTGWTAADAGSLATARRAAREPTASGVAVTSGCGGSTESRSMIRNACWSSRISGARSAGRCSTQSTSITATTPVEFAASFVRHATHASGWLGTTPRRSGVLLTTSIGALPPRREEVSAR